MLNNNKDNNKELNLIDINSKKTKNNFIIKNSNPENSNLNYNIKEKKLNNNYNIIKIQKILKFKKKTIEYIDNIYNNEKDLFEKEIKLNNKRNFQYLNYQEYIQPRMRKILIDWILEISSILNFKRQTFHLTIVLIDSFLSNYPNLEVSKLQLTGLTCLIIASKFEVIK